MVRAEFNVRRLKGQADVRDELASLFRGAAENDHFGERTEESNQFIVGADESSSREYVSIDHAGVSGDDECVSVGGEGHRGHFSTALRKIEGLLLDFTPVA